MRGFSARLAAVLWLIQGVAALAAPPPDAGEPADPPSAFVEITTTTPARLEQQADEVAGSISVLIEPAIEEQQPAAASEVLRDMPGLDIRETGTLGESITIQIRGAERFQTLVLMDGVRINSPFRGSADLGGLLIDGIDQAEAVRGSFSALYGTDAMGGVVNLRMLPPQRPFELLVSAGGGTFDTSREGLELSGKRGWGHYRLNLSRTDSNGQFDNDRFGATTISGQARVDLTSSSYVLLTPRYQYSEKQLAVTPLEFLNPVQVVWDDNNRLARQFTSSIIEYHLALRSWWELALTASTVQSDLDWDNPTTMAPVSFSYFEETRERQWAVGLQQNITWAEHQTFTIGIEHGWIDVRSNVNFNGAPFPINGRRRTRALYVQQLFTIESLRLQVGARADGDTRFGSTASPKISGSYEFLDSRTTVKASWGTGFRAPTIQELDFVPGIFGNPGLDPETSMSWEIGLRQPFVKERLIIEVTGFQIDFDDLIVRSPPPAKNLAHARSRGVETELTAQPLANTRLTVNHTWLDTRAEGGEALAFSHRHRLNLGVSHSPAANLTIHIDLNYISAQKLPVDFQSPDGSIEGGRSPGFIRVDAIISYELVKRPPPLRRLVWFVKGANLLNAEYQEVPGFPAPGQAFFTGIKAYL
ncbi:MAG: TonB-dependent receptor [Nitrospirota bacterium]